MNKWKKTRDQKKNLEKETINHLKSGDFDKAMDSYNKSIEVAMRLSAEMTKAQT